jgi:dCMP deaminase
LQGCHYTDYGAGIVKKYDQMYLYLAFRVAQESKCPRTQVGCVAVAESGMIAPGFNGHASGGPNEWDFEEHGNPEVVHAELNALGKMLEQGVSAKGSTMYLTLSPCLDCAKLLVRAKVSRVVFGEKYRITTGIDYLMKYGVEVEQMSKAERFKKQWAGRVFMCPKTGEQFIIPTDVRECDFFNIGECFLDVGRLDAYNRRSPQLVELK